MRLAHLAPPGCRVGHGASRADYVATTTDNNTAATDPGIPGTRWPRGAAAPLLLPYA